jgi:histidyl-tRNA synthetase
MEFHALSGMRDYVGTPAEDLKTLYRTAEELFQSAGYREISTPVMEDARLFDRSLGSESDVVSKEMYTVKQGGDRMIALRPENTAGVVRSVIQNDMMSNRNQLKVFYTGPMFRHERPQSGRLRQFHQVGGEVFGREDALCDAEVIQLGRTYLDRLGLEDVTLHLNSIGDPEDRAEFVEALRDALEPYRDELSEDDRRRLDENPLRVLDSKDETCQEICEREAPSIGDYLGDEARSHYDDLRRYLDHMDIDYIHDETLVRGLDYYQRTTFEFVTGDLGSQDAVLAGGRYDGLSEQLGGDSCPGIGFAAGVERLMLLRGTYETEDVETSVDCYLIPFNEDCLLELLDIAERLREVESPDGDGYLSVEVGQPENSLRSLMRRANRYSARAVVMLGDDEREEDTVSLKNMVSGDQFSVPYPPADTLIDEIKSLLADTHETPEEVGAT